MSVDVVSFVDSHHNVRLTSSVAIKYNCLPMSSVIHELVRKGSLKVKVDARGRILRM